MWEKLVNILEKKKQEIKDQKYLTLPLKKWNIFYTENKQSKINKCDLKIYTPLPPPKKIYLPTPAPKKIRNICTRICTGICFRMNSLSVWEAFLISFDLSVSNLIGQTFPSLSYSYHSILLKLPLSSRGSEHVHSVIRLYWSFGMYIENEVKV